jgi:hypothetical protein
MGALPVGTGVEPKGCPVPILPELKEPVPNEKVDIVLEDVLSWNTVKIKLFVAGCGGMRCFQSAVWKIMSHRLIGKHSPNMTSPATTARLTPLIRQQSFTVTMSSLPPPKRRRQIAFKRYSEMRHEQLNAALKNPTHGSPPTPAPSADFETPQSITATETTSNEPVPDVAPNLQEFQVTLEDFDAIRPPSSHLSLERQDLGQSIFQNFSTSLDLINELSKAVEMDGHSSSINQFIQAELNAEEAEEEVEAPQEQDLPLIAEDLDIAFQDASTDMPEQPATENRFSTAGVNGSQPILPLADGVTVHDSQPKPDSKSMTDFTLAFAIFCEGCDITRTQYAKLLECCTLLVQIDEIHALPATVDTLRLQLRSRLPTPPIYTKTIPVVQEKQSISKQKPALVREAQMYFVNAKDLIQSILQSDQERANLHFGLAELVDEPCELWHSEAWAESVRTCSGRFAMYPATQEPVIPSDFVRYISGDEQLIGRILRVYKDLRNGSSTKDSVVLILQQCVPATTLGLVDCDPPPLSNELFLVEKEVLISDKQLVCRIPDVLYDRGHKTASEIVQEQLLHAQQEKDQAARQQKSNKQNSSQVEKNTMTSPPYLNQKPTLKPLKPSHHQKQTEPTDYTRYTHIIRRIVSLPSRSVRSCRLAHPVVAELECETYGRVTRGVISLENQLVG